MDKENILVVRTLGDFSMTWNGKQIGGGVKARNSQFTRLMQIILHFRSQGVERTRLEELLFGESNSDDIHHVFRTLIYNTKKKLREAGLPDIDYIKNENNRYYWTSEIPVEEDCEQFEEMCRAADAEEDPAVKAGLYKKACLAYDGEFLPHQTSLVWVIREDRKYRDIFCDSMDKAILLMRDLNDYASIEELGRHAALINPLAEWEFVTMEALAALGKRDEARRLYEDTVDLYMRELGTRPSADMMDMFNRLGDSADYHFGLIDDIQAGLSGAAEPVKGGYFCTYPVFQGIYRLVERMLDRGGQSVYLMLCTIVDSHGDPMKDGSTLTKLAERLCDAICRAVRHSDVVCRYGKGQFLVLLINTTIENCDIVEKRINSMFLTSAQKTGVSYHVSVVTYEPFS